METSPDLCSFCRRHQRQVARLIHGPGGVQISNHCVVTCTEVLSGHYVGRHPLQPNARPPLQPSRWWQLARAWRSRGLPAT